MTLKVVVALMACKPFNQIAWIMPRISALLHLSLSLRQELGHAGSHSLPPWRRGRLAGLEQQSGQLGTSSASLKEKLERSIGTVV